MKFIPNCSNNEGEMIVKSKIVPEEKFRWILNDWVSGLDCVSFSLQSKRLIGNAAVATESRKREKIIGYATTAAGSAAMGSQGAGVSSTVGASGTEGGCGRHFSLSEKTIFVRCHEDFREKNLLAKDEIEKLLDL